MNCFDVLYKYIISSTLPSISFSLYLCLGILFAERNLFEKMHNLYRDKIFLHMGKIIVAAVVLCSLFILRHKTGMMLDITDAFWLYLLFISALNSLESGEERLKRSQDFVENIQWICFLLIRSLKRIILKTFTILLEMPGLLF